MLRISLITLFALGAVGSSLSDEIDLSRSAQSFPTRSVSGHGCPTAYDRSDRDSKALCKPFFPISLEISGIREQHGHKGPSALAVFLRNTGDHPVDLPSSPIQMKGTGKGVFISRRLFAARKRYTRPETSHHIEVLRVIGTGRIDLKRKKDARW